MSYNINTGSQPTNNFAFTSKPTHQFSRASSSRVKNNTNLQNSNSNSNSMSNSMSNNILNSFPNDANNNMLGNMGNSLANNMGDNISRQYVNGSSIGYGELNNRKQVLRDLIGELKQSRDFTNLDVQKRQEYSKRLTLLEQQIEGLIRQTSQFGGNPGNPGQKTLDYSYILLQKQNQINQLERKITYLQSQLRMKDHRQNQLQKQLQNRLKTISNRNQQISNIKNNNYNNSNQNNHNNSHNSNYDSNNTQLATRKLVQILQKLNRSNNNSVSKLDYEIQNWILSLPNESELKSKFKLADQKWLQDKYKKYVSYIATQATTIINSIHKIYNAQIATEKSKGVKIDIDPKMTQLLPTEISPVQLIPSEAQIYQTTILPSLVNQPLLNSSHSFKVTSTQYPQTNRITQKVTVQVPVQDKTTKALIKRLTYQMKKLFKKYPQLEQQITPELREYLSQQILDMIQIDELDKLVEIVKYKPDVVKVENVYNYSSSTSKKTEFHLKVLIKALLDQMHKLTRKTGVQAQIDEGVIQMIRTEIMDIVDIEQILRIYRVVPKIVQVEKIVEHVVEKIVPVPHFITVANNSVQPVPINRVSVVQNTVNVPMQVPQIQVLTQEKLILGNQYQQRVVAKPQIQQHSYETLRQVPTVRSVQKVVTLPHEVVQTVEVQGPERIVPVQREIIKTIIEQKIVPVEKVVERIVQVQKIVEKLVPVLQQVVKIVEVEKIVQKAVPIKQYVQSQRIQNYVVQKPLEVVCYVQKIVPVERIIEKLVTHPQIVQKLVPLVTTQQVLKQIQVLRQVPIYQKELIVQDRIVQTPLPPLIHETPKIVQQILEVPFIHEKIRVETEYRKEPIIQKQLKVVRQPVHIQVPVVLYEQRVLEVEKPMVQILREQYPRQVIRDRVIPVETVRDQLIPTPFIVQKIIEKLVEVPKVVEVEKIVEKIVLVPRIVQKIVEVQKIIEKIVQKNIYHTNIQPVQLVSQVPYQVQKLITIQLPTYIVQSRQVPHHIQVPVPVISQTYTNSTQVYQLEQPPRVAIQRRQVPIEIIKQKIVPMVVQDHVYVQLKEQIVVPMEISVPVTLIEQKIIPVEHVVPLIQPVDRIVQRLVGVRQEREGRVEVRDRIVEKMVVSNDVKVVRDQIPYYNQEIKEVVNVIQKVVPVQRIIQEIIEIPTLIQKVVQSVIQVPNIYQIQKVVHIPLRQQELITVDRIVPKIVTLNKAFAHIVDKLHEFPRLAQQMRQVERKVDNLVIQNNNSTDILETQVMVQKAVIQQKLKEVDKYINVVNEQIKVVDRIIEKPTEPIIITEQKILEVPVIVEKLAERIVVMPQVVEVLKYVHQIVDNDNLGVVNTTEREAQYQRLGKSVNKQLMALRGSLDMVRGGQYRSQIQTIDRYLSQFNKFLTYPRISDILTTQKVTTSKTVQYDRRGPLLNSHDEQRYLSNLILLQNLLNSLKRIKLNNPRIDIDLGPDSHLILNSFNRGEGYESLYSQYEKAIFSRFGSLTTQQQRMLKQFLQQRFQLANRIKKLTKQLTKYKQLHNLSQQKFNRQKYQHQNIIHQLQQLRRYKDTQITKTTNTIIRQDHSQCQNQINRLKNQLFKCQSELQRLRIIQSIHNKCSPEMEKLRKKILEMEEQLRIRSEKLLSGTSPGSGYGRNYMEYIDAKQISEHDNSLSSSENGRGVYRSAGNYQSIQHKNSDNGGSMGYIPNSSSQYLDSSRRSGELRVNSNKPMTYSNYQRDDSRSSKLGSKEKDIGFNYQVGSKMQSSEGGSEILYGNSPREIMRRYDRS